MSIDKVVCDYYGNPTLYKWENKQGHSLYICKIRSLTLNNNRYLIAAADEDVYLPNTPKLLSDIRWRVFQARELSDKLLTEQPAHSYQPRSTNSQTIQKLKKDDVYTYYTCPELGIDVLLLNDEKAIYEYPASATLVSALETYKTLLIKQS